MVRDKHVVCVACLCSQTPPTSGEVFLGYLDQDHQSDLTELQIHWTGFSDIEETTTDGLIVHENGIANYRVSVGECQLLILKLF